jgi:hypothetical protein
MKPHRFVPGDLAHSSIAFLWAHHDKRRGIPEIVGQLYRKDVCLIVIVYDGFSCVLSKSGLLAWVDNRDLKK